MTTQITEPGVYDIPEDVYHADPVPGGSLSVSGAKKLLPPSCPARYHYDREHPPAPKPQFDLGHAAHRLVLGEGAEWVVVDAADWRTKAAREARDQAHAVGAVPLLAPQYEQVQAMAAALRAHPLAAALLNRDGVTTEKSFFWVDPEYGVWRRARLDAYRRQANGVLVITDYKTADSAEPGTFAKAAANYGYHQQHDWYCDAVADCLGEDAAFVFVVQEKTPPYLVSVCELEPGDVAAGAARNRRALEIYRDCQAVDAWPGYEPLDDIARISLPTWARTREDIYA